MSAEKKTDFQIVNHSIPRRDGRVKVTGKAQYVADLRLIGMAYAKVLRSPYRPRENYFHRQVEEPKPIPASIASSPATISTG